MKSTSLFMNLLSCIFLICLCCPVFSYAQNNGATPDAFYIAPSGNVGIGTSNPSGRLTVEGKTFLNGDVNIGTGGSSVIVDGRAGFKETVKIKNVEMDAGDAGLKVNSRVKDQAGYIMPVGGIIMYSATEADINRYFNNVGEGLPGSPVEGWAICNGEKGRPDLRGRFVVGIDRRYSKGDRAYDLENDYKPQGTGGKTWMSLTEGQMPQHSHAIANFSNGDAMYSTSGFGCTCTDNRTSFVKGWNGDVGDNGSANKIGKAGKGEAFDNRPPYYAVLYLIKL